MRVVFLENYTMNVARHLVQGVDVWVNTPRRPREASGTSGMKCAVNGVLNLSVRDGWWDEAYTPEVGWSIGSGETYDDPHEEDAIQSEALYRVLKEEVVPAYYDRNGGSLPTEWIARMKASLRRLVPVFNSHRMVREYVDTYYLHAAGAGKPRRAGPPRS